MQSVRLFSLIKRIDKKGKLTHPLCKRSSLTADVTGEAYYKHGFPFNAVVSFVFKDNGGRLSPAPVSDYVPLDKSDHPPLHQVRLKLFPSNCMSVRLYLLSGNNWFKLKTAVGVSNGIKDAPPLYDLYHRMRRKVCWDWFGFVILFD